MLVRKHKFCERVVSHDAVIVCRTQAFEEAVRDGKEGNVLNIWIMIRAVGDDVMNIVVALPPAATQAAKEIRDDDTDAAVHVKVVSDAHVTCVVNSEDQLVPEHSEEYAREGVPTTSKQEI